MTTTLEALRLAIAAGALLAISVADLRERRIPNRIVLPATAACAVLRLAEGVPSVGDLSALMIVAGLLAVSVIAPAALGMGDVKLALLIAVALGGDGARALVVGFALAALAGLVILVRHGASARTRALPLAPFLAGGALVTALLG